MPVQIGASVHNFSDPTGLLSDCHRRIEMFLGSLEAVAKVLDRPVTDETARALASALLYFREAAPKHTADEEESLFPRLRRIREPEAQSALEQLDKLESDHRWAAPLHEKIERLGQQYLSNGSLSGNEATSFRAAAANLETMYRRHIEVEETVIFPVAASVLSQTDRTAIAQEMAERRKVRLITGISERLAQPL